MEQMNVKPRRKGRQIEGTNGVKQKGKENQQSPELTDVGARRTSSSWS